MRNRKQKKINLLLLGILGLTVGFALLSTTLKINGTALLKKNTFDIHWDSESVQVSEDSTEGDVPTVTGTNDNIVVFTANLGLPGDYYEFYVDAVNEGTVNGKISKIDKKIYDKDDNEISSLPSYLTYKVVYGDTEEEPKPGDKLKAGKVRTYKIRVDYVESVTSLQGSGDLYKFEIEITYEQDGVGKIETESEEIEDRVCAQFEEDSWDTIKENVSKRSDVYPIGCEKEVTLGNDLGTHKVRIANNTTPEECDEEGFSQTACGFVLEFSDIITTHRMNTWNNSGNSNGDGNRGGWEYSDMRAYLNGTIYAAENIDYSTEGIYNALPTDLKKKIVNTYVVSGHGSKDTNNFITTDKIYLLTGKEVENITSTSWDTASGDEFTRQLDYYRVIGVAENNEAGAIKQYNGSNTNWWLRAANGQFYKQFYFIRSDGYWTNENPDNYYGVSPAFRLWGEEKDEDDIIPETSSPVKTSKTSDTTCKDKKAPKCVLNYVKTLSNGFEFSFSCTDETKINRITSLFDHDPYSGQYDSSTFDTIGTIKNGTVINGGKTKAYTSRWTTAATSNPPNKNTCYYFSYGGEDECGNWSVYHTDSCYNY